MWGWSFIVIGQVALVGHAILKKLDSNNIRKEGLDGR
jgi:hypothetical protein